MHQRETYMFAVICYQHMYYAYLSHVTHHQKLLKSHSNYFTIHYYFGSLTTTCLH